MAGESVTLPFLPEVQAALNSLRGRQLVNQVNWALKAAGQFLSRKAKQAAPKRSGGLRKGITSKPLRKRGSEVAALRIWGKAPHSSLAQLGIRERFRFPKPGKRVSTEGCRQIHSWNEL